MTGLSPALDTGGDVQPWVAVDGAGAFGQRPSTMAILPQERSGTEPV